MVREYRAPSRSIRDTVNTAPAENALRAVPKKLAPVEKDFFTFRILSLDPDDTRQVKCRLLTKITQKKNRKITVAIHEELVWKDPEEVLKSNDLSQYVDPVDGNTLDEGKFNSLFRIPILLLEGSTNGGKKSVEYNELRYIELTYGQFQSILELEDDSQLDLTFDANSNKPDYDIKILRNADSGQDTWKVIGLQNMGKAQHPNYHKSDEDIVGGADNFQACVIDHWSELQDAMDEFMDEKDIAREIGSNKRTGLSSRPEMPEGAGEVEESEIDVEQAVQEIAAADAGQKTQGRRTRQPEADPKAAQGEPQTRSFGFGARRSA